MQAGPDLSTIVNPSWIIIGSVIGLHGLWKWPMSIKRKFFMCGYAVITLLLAGVSWKYSTDQVAHDKVADERANRSEKSLEDTKTIIAGLANDLQIRPNDSLSQTLALLWQIGLRLMVERRLAVRTSAE
jgi:uncharacterized membrane protein YiaA